MLFPVQHMDILAHFNIAVTFDTVAAVARGHARIFTFVTTFQRETHAQQIATSNRPYLVVLIVAVYLEIRDRSKAINGPMAPESHTASELSSRSQSVADGI